ncbi:MAG: hypothetical protein KJO21_12210 [Verrucomicrobiae bacterium]|nr:hypothetical protein [Verrucomicrobiae bacterium]NNJ43983.1 hypothetical protein [Akkermansiaceae bacterium]
MKYHCNRGHDFSRVEWNASNKRVSIGPPNHKPNKPMNPENNHEEMPRDTEKKRHFDSCSDAFRSGRDDATAKAREAAPELKAAIADVIFDVAYGTAYGAFFASAFANEFVPQTVKDGVSKGAAAGRRAADKVRRGSAQKNASHGDRAENVFKELPGTV